MGKQTIIKVVDFQPQHIREMEIRDIEKTGLMTLEGIDERLEQIKERPGKAGTLIHEGRVLCCAGVTLLWGGVAEVWIVPSVHVRGVWISFSKTIREYLESSIQAFNLHRLQTDCLDDELHGRWMKWLGFEKECTMKWYTHDKKDYCKYRRLIK